MSKKAPTGLAVATALGLGVPAFAQDSDAPVDVTAAPPPSNETIGPSQLRNFNLQGTVTRPAEQSSATTSRSTTAAAPPRNGEAVPSEAAAARPPSRTGSANFEPRPAAGPRSSPSIPSTITADPAPVTPAAPLEVTTDPAPQTTDPAADLTPPALDSDSSFASPAWIAALIALLGGGLLIAWMRRGRRERYGDAGRMAFAGLALDGEAEARPLPPARPRPDPVPPRARPEPAPTPRADPVPSGAAAPRPTPSDDGMIVSTGLKPKLNFEFAPDRAVVTDREVMLQFDVVLSNNGGAPARDVLVEAKLVPAHAGQDQEIAAFFQNPKATGDRMEGIPPHGKVALKSVVRLPLDQLHSFEVEGRKLFVPLVAFNVLYRAGGTEDQTSASFLVGRGNAEDEKLAPFRLDLGPRIFRDLSSRPHSTGLSRPAA